ncbi:MAG TPA: cob(I)yrinic acid a,c-diamide adenosyltransferase [Petrotoga sp.]|nr:cob(I)yrinic acid a,c-diamide adenosyltransferase [Petrotoga sp.]
MLDSLLNNKKEEYTVSISTKTGDKGETSLWSGERVSKDDIRVEAYGTVDELNAFLSETNYYLKSHQVKKIINEVQNDLFKVAGELASKSKPYKYPIQEEDVLKITNYVYAFENRLNLKGFVIPGKTLQSAKLDICRTIARRAERRIIALDKKEPVPEPLKKYVNRLSDLLFILARFEEYIEDKIEFKKW